MSNNIEAEPEDLFVGNANERQRKEESVAELDGEAASELDAAAALTSLVSARCLPAEDGKKEDANDEADIKQDDIEDAEDGKVIEIPQRYTKSGRKRAVSFPLKVSIKAARRRTIT